MIKEIRQKEGNKGQKPFVFTVSLSASSTQPVFFISRSRHHTTLLCNYYLDVCSFVIFPVGTISQSITVMVNGDTDPEQDETFLIRLSNPTNATIGKGQGDRKSVV